MFSAVDHVSDLHLDNGMMGGPHAFLQSFDLRPWKTSASRCLLVAGDTAEHPEDVATVLNLAGGLYDRVFAILGNHERGAPTGLADNVVVLDRDTPAIALGDALLIGASLFHQNDVARVIARTMDAMDSPVAAEVVVLVHAVPSDGVLWRGAPMPNKVVELVRFLPPPTKPAVIVYGHSHVPDDRVIRGYRCVTNPRGYRGERRDGSQFKGFQKL